MRQSAKVTMSEGRMKSCLGARALLAALFLVFSIQLINPLAVLGQENVGAIIGVVRDPSGAVLPNASIKARAVSTGVAVETKSNSTGVYAFPLLPIGEYTVTVAASGFKTLERPGVRIVSSRTETLDLALELGAASQTVQVTGQGETVDATTTTVGTTRVSEELSELPLLNLGANRSVVSLLRTFPGVAALPTLADDPTYSGGIGNTAINGAPEGGGSYTMDGVLASNTVSGGLRDDFQPPPEMIEEMRLNATNTVEYGANAGVGVVVVTKSGTNQLHGGVFEYLRNDAVDAKNYFASKVTPNKQNEFGFTLGGPVVLPHIYNGKDKTFFFGMYSGFRFRTTPAGVTLTTATPLMQQGDFSEWLGAQIGTDALGRPIYTREIYDPTTTRSVPDPSNPGQTVFVRDPYAYNGKLNVIPPSQLSAISQYFAKFLPAPTRAGTQNNFVGSQTPSPENTDKFFLRVDHNFGGGSQRITGEIDKQWRTNITGGNWGSTPITTTWDFNNIATRVRFNYTWVIGANKILGIRLGVNRYNQGILFDPAALTGFAGAGLQGLLYPASPSISIDLLGNFGQQFGDEILQHTTVLPIYSDFSWVHANHNVKVGASYVQSAFARADTNRPGGFGFSNFETGLPGFQATGIGFASFLTGTVDNAGAQTGAARLYRAADWAWYAEDSWRVVPKLTVNYGVRLDYFINAREQHDMIGFFDPTLPNPGAGGLPGADSFFGTGPGRNGMHNIGPSSGAWSPHLGFAYSLTPKTVFRAGYGLSTNAEYGVFGGGNNLPYTGWGWSGSVFSADQGVTPAFNWQQTKGIPLTPPPLPRLDPTLDNGGNPQGWNPNDIKPARIQNISAGIERQLPGNILLNVSYVGTLSHGLPDGFDFSPNQLNTQYLSLGNLLTQNVNSPAAQAAGIKVPYAGFNSSVAQALLPFPQYGYTFDLVTRVGYSEYNSLQVTLAHRFGHGLSFLVAYTNSKQLTNLSSFGGQGFPVTENKHQNNASIPTKTLSTLDRPQNLSLSWVYQLPFGPGKRFANSTNPVLKHIVGGWQVTGLQQYTSGVPITMGTEQSIVGNFGPIWANRVPGVPILKTSCGSYNPNDPARNQLLNINAFADPAPFTFGNTSVLGNVRNCPYFNENFSAQKMFRIHERGTVLFSADFSNIFNRHEWLGGGGGAGCYFNCYGVGTDIDNPATFGQYTSATDPRLVQFHLKVEF